MFSEIYKNEESLRRCFSDKLKFYDDYNLVLFNVMFEFIDKLFRYEIEVTSSKHLLEFALKKCLIFDQNLMILVKILYCKK